MCNLFIFCSTPSVSSSSILVEPNEGRVQGGSLKYKKAPIKNVRHPLCLPLCCHFTFGNPGSDERQATEKKRRKERHERQIINKGAGQACGRTDERMLAHTHRNARAHVEPVDILWYLHGAREKFGMRWARPRCQPAGITERGGGGVDSWNNFIDTIRFNTARETKSRTCVFCTFFLHLKSIHTAHLSFLTHGVFRTGQIISDTTAGL